MPSVEPLTPDGAVSGLRWIGSARILTQTITWAMTLLTVRLLHPQDYGLVATAGLFTIFANLLLDGGLSLVLVSEHGLSARQYGAAFSWVMVVSVALGAVIIAIAPYAAAFFRMPPLARVLQVSTVQLPLGALLVVPQALLTKERRFREIAIAQLVASIVQASATLLMANEGAAYWSLVIGTLIGSATRVAIQWLYLREAPAPNFAFLPLLPLMRQCLHMMGQRVVYFFTSDFDIFALGRLAGPTALGSYALAKTLAHTALDQLAGVVNQVSVPVFAGKRGDLRAQLDGLILLISTVSVLVFPLFWLMGVLSQVALPLLLGARWTKLVVPFMAFTFILPLRSIYTLLDSAVVGTGRVSTTFKNMLAWAAIMMPLLLVGASFGANAAAGAWIVGFPVVFSLAMRRIARAFQCNVLTLLGPMLAPLIWTAASCFIVELTMILMLPRLVPLAQLAAEVAVGAACYYLLMRSFAHAQYQQVLKLALRLAGR